MTTRQKRVSSLPAICVRLWQTDVGKNAAGKLVRHLIERGRPKIVGGDERKDSRSSVSGAVHVANVDFVERRFADAKNQWTLFFEAHVGGTLNQMGSAAVGNAGQRSDAARNDDHRVGRVGTAGDICADVGVRLLPDFARSMTENLAEQIAAAAKTKLFGDDAKGAVGGDEIYGLNARIALNRLQQMTREQRAAGAGCGDGQVLRRGHQFAQMAGEGARPTQAEF